MYLVKILHENAPLRTVFEISFDFLLIFEKFRKLMETLGNLRRVRFLKSSNGMPHYTNSMTRVPNSPNKALRRTVFDITTTSVNDRKFPET